MANKYSTIIYTDVVGYSRLTGEDQELALELLSEHDKILHKYTKHYNGNIIKETGDGICAMFDNPVNAIKCSIDIQKDLNKRNQLNSKNRQVQIRIGIHYGTYVIKDSEVYGDTINISKLIEASAPHGGIAISKEVNDLVWNVNDIYTKLINSEDHYEFKNSNKKLSDIEDLVKRKVILYDHKAKSSDYKFGTEFKLKTIGIEILPDYIKNNKDHFKNWIDNN